MLIVTVELKNAHTGELSTLQVINIVNDGSGTKELGNYYTQQVYPKRCRPGFVNDYPRLTQPVGELVAKSLKALGYEA